ncbi:unnamed protein product [Gadus morhua 'NCC']
MNRIHPATTGWALNASLYARGSGGAKAGPDTVAPALEQIKVLGEKAPSRPLNSEDKASPLWPNNTGHGRLISRTG